MIGFPLLIIATLAHTLDGLVDQPKQKKVVSQELPSIGPPSSLDNVEEDSFHQCLKFVNRDQQCYDCVATFHKIYDRYRGIIVNKTESPYPSAYTKIYPLISCAGAPGIGKSICLKGIAAAYLDHINIM
jgi:hypothetical protein